MHKGHSTRPNRRLFLLGATTAGLAGVGACAPRQGPFLPIAPIPTPLLGYEAIYGERADNGQVIEALDLGGIDPEVLRKEVRNPTGEPPGTIVVSTSERRLYHVGEDGSAMRYGIGVGREGLAWAGRARVGRKAVWPGWTPTARMIARDPRNAQWAGGMPGGIENPLGARALYLYDGNRDTMYRLHGTNEPWSIGGAVSSGCIRLFNHDIIDLHARTSNGTRVLVRR